MSSLSFNEVKVFEDTATDDDVIRNIIKAEHEASEEPFCILDVANVMQKHKNWIAKMPRIIPHYAIKCNSDPILIKTLAAMNVSFDCASDLEIQAVMRHGVSGDRIIFANPTKWPNHIKYAKKVNVEKMTADSEMEIRKISEIFPEAKVVIRFRCDAKDCMISLGSKFGCDPEEEAVRLIHLTKSLNLMLWGFSFHVGSPCGEFGAYKRGITMCKRLIAIAKEIGCRGLKMIDIGGGFPGERQSSIDKTASVINDVIKDVDPSITIISEPGQYYATSAFTLVSQVHTKRLVSNNEKLIRMYYMNCGVYNGFIEELLNFKARLPETLDKPASDEKFLSSVWGPTCDSLDCILKNVFLPEVHPKQWMIWKDMGSYSIGLSSSFNGFGVPKVHPFARKSQWEEFVNFIKAPQKTSEFNSLIPK